MKKLSELQAWKELRNAWLYPKSSGGTYYHSDYYGDVNYGLCSSIRTMWGQNRISLRMKKRLDIKIKREKSRIGRDGYIWNLDQNGAKSRVKFCERKIKNLKSQKVGYNVHCK